MRKINGPIFAACLGLGVLILRALSSGPAAYFADGPSHLSAIAAHTYVIQPPGYWLFNRIGGLFPNPEHALLGMNWLFSVLGCVVFYACARRLVRTPFAELGAIVYATTFFAWFSGDVHSTYASQLFFAPMTFYAMLRYREDQQNVWLFAVAASYAIGAGFRPSDGVFLAPLLLLFLLQIQRKQRLILVAVVTGICLAWLIPNQSAQHRYHIISTGGALTAVATGSVVLGRLNVYTISNALRFFLPLAVALGPAAFYMFLSRNAARWWLWVWVLPGTLFFLLLYISDAPYLDCLLGGFILLALLGMEASRNHKAAVLVLVATIAINLVAYLGFRPLSSHARAYAIVEKDLGNYTLYAVKHQMFVQRLSMEGK